MVTKLFQNPFSGWLKPKGAKPARPAVLVKQLEERDRRRMLKHFIGLDDSDRLLRFGTVLPDQQVAAYVNKIDLGRDTVYGVYNRVFKLVAVGHLAFAPKQPHAAPNALTDKDRDKDTVAEFGVSVSKSARGLGIGTKLFERAAIHCRNCDVDTLYMHCLSSNQTMMHIAKKAGMQIERDYGEADAHLRLLPASPGTVLQEALQEQFATIDYTLKANTRAAVKWFER
ncbi:MAG: GNAT family N-acetyltransferase [Pseudomonadota bacterium]|nr:GNAT family N-acetyltransferase [Pseudomonadota bacterium]